MLENLRENHHILVDIQSLIPHACDASRQQQSRQRLAAFRVTLEHSEQSIHAHCYHRQGEHVEAYACPACRHRCCVVARKVCQRQAGLLERHPEEDDDGKHEAQRHHAFLGLFRRELYDLLLIRRLLAFAHVDVLERLAEAEVDGYREYQRDARDAEAVAVSHRQ